MPDVTNGGSKPAALQAAIELAQERTSEYRGRMLFARQEAGFQTREFQHFFLAGIYQMLHAGARSACNAEIIGSVVTPEAEAFLRERCVNPYWFWSVIAAAASQAKDLPLSLTDIKAGVAAVLHKHTEPMQHTHWTGSPQGYSGPETPWHIYDAFTRHILWNNNEVRERGLSMGMLLLTRASLKKSPWRHPSWQSFDGMAIIFNPLFEEFAIAPPAVSSGENVVQRP